MGKTLEESALTACLPKPMATFASNVFYFQSLHYFWIDLPLIIAWTGVWYAVALYFPI